MIEDLTLFLFATISAADSCLFSSILLQHSSSFADLVHPIVLDTHNAA